MLGENVTFLTCKKYLRQSLTRNSRWAVGGDCTTMHKCLTVSIYPSFICIYQNFQLLHNFWMILNNRFHVYKQDTAYRYTVTNTSFVNSFLVENQYSWLSLIPSNHEFAEPRKAYISIYSIDQYQNNEFNYTDHVHCIPFLL